MANSSFATRLFRNIAKLILVLFLLLNTMFAFHAWKFTHFYNDAELRKPHQNNFISTLGFILTGSRMPKRLNDSVVSAPHTTVWLQTSDGLKLEAWAIPCTGFFYDSAAALRSTINYHKGTVIMFHGHGSCKAAILPEAYAFLRMGYNVFTVDFRAHGNSEGEQCLVGMKETADVKAAYDWVKKTGETNVVLFGVSMGAATITRTVKEYQIKPSKLILEMPFATMLDGTKGKLRTMGLPPALGGLLTFWGGTLNGQWAFSYKPYEYAKAIQCPVLLQWGRHDPRVGLDETTGIYNNLAGKKQLVIYESCAHESLLAKEPAKWNLAVKGFLSN